MRSALVQGCNQRPTHEHASYYYNPIRYCTLNRPVLFTICTKGECIRPVLRTIHLPLLQRCLHICLNIPGFLHIVVTTFCFERLIEEMHILVFGGTGAYSHVLILHVRSVIHRRMWSGFSPRRTASRSRTHFVCPQPSKAVGPCHEPSECTHR